MQNNNHNLRHDFQRGSALFISLIMLLLISILGITAMQGTVREEKMAGNTKDFNLAFQAAESALREGEQNLQAFDSEPLRALGSCSSPCVWESGGMLGLTDVESYNDDDLWSYSGGPVFPVVTIALPEINTKPKYQIGYVAALRDSQTLGQQQDNSPGSYKNFYRLIARGTGGTDTAKVHLESIYARRF